MKVWALLMWVSCLSWRSKADHRTYLVTAPASFCLDATETVLLQLFGFTEEVIVTLYLKTSKAVGHTVLAQEEVRLNARNHHQAIAKVRIHAHQLDKTVNNVILQVQSQTRELNGDISVPVRRSNGFLFIQTDKPLYTPNQSVKVRVFSMNQELRPASRTVFLTFRDPDYTTVDIVSLDDPNNGVPSMQNPFKIPIKQILPSISIFMEPELNFISYGQFTRFSFKISARYLHGAPVVDGDVYVRYGHVSGKDPPVIIPNSVRRDGLSSTGEIEMTVNMEEILSKENGPRTLDNLVGKYLYIAVLVQENGGGISQEAEFASVKFVRSPYTLVLVSTPPFIKPGLPYNIQVSV
ncbi:hypothetical protein INR49_022883 [Caranx melampygus]|nr:hypothetical protein INR49_022883 [Caranx melampygus]